MGCVLGDCVGYAWCVGLFVSMWSEYVGVGLCVFCVGVGVCVMCVWCVGEVCLWYKNQRPI